MTTSDLNRWARPLALVSVIAVWFFASSGVIAQTSLQLGDYSVSVLPLNPEIGDELQLRVDKRAGGCFGVGLVDTLSSGATINVALEYASLDFSAPCPVVFPLFYPIGVASNAGGYSIDLYEVVSIVNDPFNSTFFVGSIVSNADGFHSVPVLPLYTLVILALLVVGLVFRKRHLGLL